METRNNTGLTVVVTLLAVALLGVIGFIVYDKVLNNDTNTPNTGVTDNDKVNNDVTKQVNIEILKENVTKVISFNKLNEDFDYLKLTKKGDLIIGINKESSLYQKYSKEYSIANDILDVYVFSVGNGGYQYIYALRKDGTIDRMEISLPASASKFEWEKNYKDLKNIIYLDLYSTESPRLADLEGDSWEIYDQMITAVDTEGNSYKLDQATESIYVKK